MLTWIASNEHTVRELGQNQAERVARRTTDRRNLTWIMPAQGGRHSDRTPAPVALTRRHFVFGNIDMEDLLKIANREFSSRLILGTGRYRSIDDTLAALESSGTEMVTIALRRLDMDHPNKQTILDYIDPAKYMILPNTAGCKTADEAITVAHLARALDLPNWIKLEVIPDPTYLFPDATGTLEAARRLVQEGFTVLPYIHADPVLAKQLQEVGCATVMPLGSAIGSGQGIHTAEEVQIIIQQASVPVIVDAGLGIPSDASQAMEMGADAVLVNTAIAQANDPALMAEAFRLGVDSGRKAYLAGRITKKPYATPSSPADGIVSL